MRVELGREPKEYGPRACDCDFCSELGAAYVSDPAGSLWIQIKDAGATARLRQGDRLIDCLVCRRCGVLVGALYQDGEQSFGVVNAWVVGKRETFGDSVPVSPKKLAADEKTARWRQLWFSRVSVETVA
ncbi:MAG TPA: hypothetical protein VKG63_03275 [Steroidobacteraceae bacterium]|nr:hypothetical protein [Steroidobacteraceae bacterium]